MVKLSTGTRLLRSLVRSGKAQRRTVSKLVSQLFAAPKPKRKAKAPPKLKLTAKPLVKAVAKSAVKSAAKPAVAAKSVGKSATKLSGTAAAKSAPRTASVRSPSVALAPPHVPPAPGKWLAAHYTPPPQIGTLPGRRMSYWLYLPDHVPEPARHAGLPLIVMLHGCHQTATQFAQGTRMNQLAERAGYAVLYPQQLVSAQAQRCWKWYDKTTQDGGGDVRTIVGIINKVAQQYRIDRSRIYIAGMSAGAGMANIVALNHPQLIAAVGLHSGPMFGAGHSTMGALGVMQHGAAARVDSAIVEVLQRQPPFPAMPTMLIQGQGDKVVRPINQVQLAQQSLLLNRLSAAGPSKLALKPAGRGRNAHEIRDFYAGRKVLLRIARVAQLEHAWSGGDASLSFNDKTGPDASKMLLDFFARTAACDAGAGGPAFPRTRPQINLAKTRFK